MKAKHHCKAPEGTIKKLYGPAATECYELDGHLYVSNGEYSNSVKYCPFCGHSLSEPNLKQVVVALAKVSHEEVFTSRLVDLIELAKVSLRKTELTANDVEFSKRVIRANNLLNCRYTGGNK